MTDAYRTTLDVSIGLPELVKYEPQIKKFPGNNVISIIIKFTLLFKETNRTIMMKQIKE